MVENNGAVDPEETIEAFFRSQWIKNLFAILLPILLQSKSPWQDSYALEREGLEQR